MLLDASIFSRIINSVAVGDIKKYMVQEKKDVVVGNLTSMDGEILKYLNPNPVRARNRLPDGSLFRLTGERRYGLEVVEVPAGLTFEELINSLEKDGLYPILFPLYPKGTIGGFIATNGSGFGSYRYGFVRYKATVHELKDKDTATILAGKYPELIELDKESEYAWSGIIVDGVFKYYLPSSYVDFVEEKGASVPTGSVIRDLFSRTVKTLKREYVPVCLRSSDYNKLQEAPIEVSLGYIVDNNSPSKFYVLCGTVKYDEMDELLKYLRNNRKLVFPFPNLGDYDEMLKQILFKGEPKLKIPKQMKQYESIYVEASKCVNCGLCLEHCTAFKLTGNLLYSPVGKFNRLLTDETSFETCFGCKEDEEFCPIGIPISKIATETLPELQSERYNLTPMKVPAQIQELEAEIEKKYKYKPLFLLFVGCAMNYDPLGVEGFLQFLLKNGEKLTNFSPRVKLIDGTCCGFDKYISGDKEGANNAAKQIVKLKYLYNAKGIYFLCPEGLYVYNTFSGEKGILAYHVVKQFLPNTKIHAGCWARKLGIEGEDKECAGLFLTAYKGVEIPLKSKTNVLAICPFSTQRFSTKSVYSVFYEPRETEKNVKVEEEVSIPDEYVIDVLEKDLNVAMNQGLDKIATEATNILIGGKDYFIFIILPYLRNVILDIAKNAANPKLISYAKQLANNKVILAEKANKISTILSAKDYRQTAKDFGKKILNSPLLDYSVTNYVNSDDFIDILDSLMKNIITKEFLEELFVEISRK